MEFDILKDGFTIQQAKQLNPLVLAYVGDSVYESFIRTYIVNENRNMSVHKLHIKSISFAKAHSQCEFAKKIVTILNEEEYNIFKRGRNAKSNTAPKNADVQEYRMATGFEALIGFLYLTKQQDRLNELLDTIIKINS